MRSHLLQQIDRVDAESQKAGLAGWPWEPMNPCTHQGRKRCTFGYVGIKGVSVGALPLHPVNASKRPRTDRDSRLHRSEAYRRLM